MQRIQQLGKALSILIMADVCEVSYHADVSAWGAPSECHDDVRRGEARRYRRARKHAEAVARAPYREILRQARQRGSFNMGGGPQYDRAFGVVYARHGFPW